MTDDSEQRSRSVTAVLKAFLAEEAAGALVLLVATLVALVWANSSAAESYLRLWHAPLTVGAGPVAITADLQDWVNDGAMTVFFFVAGLEMKRELVVGELSGRRTAVLPVAAALGGCVVPALLFLAVTHGGEAARGWGIPMATDIAFAVGVLALAGRGVPAGARAMLLSVAIVDDIIAVVVIGIAFSTGLSWGWLLAAVLGLGVVVLMRSVGVVSVAAYAAVGVFVWYTGFHSGVHATIFGAVLGLMTPARPVDGRDVIGGLERALHPVSAFLVVPLFALANAGVDVRGGLLGQAFGSRVTWAVIIGFLVGKPLGVAAGAFAVRRLGVGALPADVPPRMVWGIGLLAGIGFTVALFVTDLSFGDPVLAGHARIGILTASAAAAVLGVVAMRTLARGAPASGAPASFTGTGDPPRGAGGTGA